jgi:histidinol-phosphatase
VRELLLALADTADALTVARAAAVGRVERKADDSPVTAADREVERALRARLARERPGDAVLGEEDGASGGAGGRRWLLDPIDGTVHFTRGVPLWGTLIGCEEDGAAVAGMVSSPPLGRRWLGVRGDGALAMRDGEARPAHVSDVGVLGDALFSVSRLWAAGAGARTRIDALAARCWSPGGYEAFLGPVMVAEGALDAALLPEVEPWDVVPLRAVVEAAGGRCTLLDCGAPRIGALFSNAVLHDELVAALRA